MADASEYPDIIFLDADHEAMLRRLVDADRRLDRAKRKALEIGYARNGVEGAIVRHLDQAKMLNVMYHGGDPVVLEVYAAGYSYIEGRDKEIEAERRRRQERKEDMAHDWKISVFAAMAGIIGALGGTILGYWLGAARPFL